MTEEANMTLDEVIKNDKTGKYKRIMMRRKRKYRGRNYGSNISGSKDTRRRIRVENLHKEMQNADLTSLFEKFGKLTRCGIHFDKLGQSTGIADIEFSTHEECETAINKLDNADIKGVKVRVKYASEMRNYRRNKSAGTQRRNLRRVNRLRRSRPRLTGRVSRRGGRTGTLRKGRVGTKRRVFTRTLGRRRQQRKQN